MHLVHEDDPDDRDDHRLDRVVEVVAGGCGDDARETRAVRPERIALRYPVAGQQTAGQRHEEVEGDGAQGGRPQVDVGGRVEHLVPRLDVPHGNVAGHVEAPEAGVDQEQPDRDQPGVAGMDVARRSVGRELPDPGAEDHQDAEREPARDRVDDPGGVRVVVAEELDHPAVRMPAPGRVDDPEHRADGDGEDPERSGSDPLDHRAGHDGCGGPREEQERGPEHAVDACPSVLRVSRSAHVRTHHFAPGNGVGCFHQAAGKPGAVGQCEVDPPPEEEERYGHQRDEHGVLHQGVHVILVPGRTYLVHAEPDVNQEHDHDREPVVELSEDRDQGCQLVGHLSPRESGKPSRHVLFNSVLALLQAPEYGPISRGGQTRAISEFSFSSYFRYMYMGFRKRSRKSAAAVSTGVVPGRFAPRSGGGRYGIGAYGDTLAQ